LHEAIERTAGDAPPQLQFIVVEGLQYAVLAKCVNGAYDEIWLEPSGVIV